MDTLLAPCSLADVLARRIDVVRRIGVECRQPHGLNRQRHVDQVIAEANAAMASGEAAALKAALSSVDLLSFELCNE